jgi:FkbH-like protein
MDTVKEIVSGLRRKTNGIIVFCSFEIPIFPVLGIYDSQTKNGQLAFIRELNDRLVDILSSDENACLLDLNLCIAKLGMTQFFDRRFWYIARAPYSYLGIGEITYELFKYIRASKGKNKKCLILDCDNTLWGGILGEEGVNGIQVGHTYPGSIFREFQAEVLNLHNRGVIIALCSKNNEADVLKILREHPEMVLKEEHISAYQINWDDKATNICRIAGDLNIGLNSLVFCDDSEFEIHLINDQLPEVSTIHFSQTNKVKMKEQLAECGLFDTLNITQEDKIRTKMYRAESQRKMLKAEYRDISGYLTSLQMVATIRFANQFSIPRIAQLTQKTNQFNLTTRRYTEAEIKLHSASLSWDVIQLELADRFGDYGLVGAGIIHYSGNTALIDTFLLSCRALGRGVENLFIEELLQLAKIRGSSVILGEFIPTKKNQQVESFYSSVGFAKLPDSTTERELFIYNLKNEVHRSVKHFFNVHRLTADTH